MNELIEGLVGLVGEAAGKVAELAMECAGAMLEDTAASAVAEGAGPALAGAAEGARHLANAAVDVVAFAATEGVADAAVDAMIVSDIVADAGNATTTPAQAPAPQRKRGPGEPEDQVEQLA